MAPAPPRTNAARQLVVRRRHGELREVGDDVRGRTEEDAGVGGREHGVSLYESPAATVRNAIARSASTARRFRRRCELVAGDAARRLDLERVAEERRPAELPHERLRELGEGVERMITCVRLRSQSRNASAPSSGAIPSITAWMSGSPKRCSSRIARRPRISLS
jgi:hypothetical protein